MQTPRRSRGARGPALAAVGISAALVAALSACAAPVVTIGEKPTWGNTSQATAGPAASPSGAQALEGASVPPVCNTQGGTLRGGLLVEPGATAAAVPTPGMRAPQIAADDATGAVVMAVRDGVELARPGSSAAPGASSAAGTVVVAPQPALTAGDAAVAAVIECTSDGVRYRDRLVVWTAALDPMGVINVSALVPTGRALTTDVSIAADGSITVGWDVVAGGVQPGPAVRHESAVFVWSGSSFAKRG